MLSLSLDKLAKLTPTQLVLAAALALPIVLILHLGYSSSALSRASGPLEPDVTEDKLRESKAAEGTKGEEKKTSIMQAEVDGLTRKYVAYTLEQLRPFDGSVPGNPIYVSIKGAYST